MNQMYVPPLTKTNKILIIIVVLLFLMQSLGVNLLPYLGLNLSGILSGFIYKFLTYPLIELNFTSVIFNLLLLWFIGSDLELKWGSSFYRKFLIYQILFTGLFSVLAINLVLGIRFSLSGLSGVNFSLLIAYAMVYKDRYLTFMLIFPMKAKYFSMLLIGIELYMTLFSQSYERALPHLISILFAYVFLNYSSMKARGLGFSDYFKRRKKENLKKKFTLIKDEPKNPKFWQ